MSETVTLHCDRKDCENASEEPYDGWYSLFDHTEEENLDFCSANCVMLAASEIPVPETP